MKILPEINILIFLTFCSAGFVIKIPGSKGLSQHELAHKRVKDLLTRPDMSIKMGWSYCPAKLFIAALRRFHAELKDY